MEPASLNGVPGNVLIVEDDPIIALDFEDTILGFGVKAVRTAGNV
ncbi:MAG: response regulator, partial [Bradyrhizobium sp.]|nr:response regulator [Bradyrhizobium sp.]